MKNAVFLLFLIILLFSPFKEAAAQSSLSTTETTTVSFDTTGFPQWAKDLRRWNIITFGLFPFSMFVVSFTTDMIRWYNANNFDWSAEGRRYAPWPMKSAGGVEMTNHEFRQTILLALGLSASIALVDLLIVNLKRNKERRRLESMPSGSYEIEREPYGEQPEVDPGGIKEDD